MYPIQYEIIHKYQNGIQIIRSGKVKSNNVFGEWMFDALTNKNMATTF